MNCRLLKRCVAACAPAIVLVLLLASSAVAANKLESTARVGEDIRYLASDELEGRGPGTDGLQKAADYIRDEFQRHGLTSGSRDGSFMQPFEIVIDTKVVEPKTKLVLRGPEGQELKLELGADYQPLATGGAGSAKADVVFAGYGITAPKIEYDDYQNADIEGKVVLIIRREPQQDDDKSPFDGKKVTTHSLIRTKLAAAKKQKAAAVLFVNDPFTTKTEKKDELTLPGGFGTGSLGMPFAHVTHAVADRLLESTPVKVGEDALTSVEAIEQRIDEELKPLTQPLSGWTAEFECAFEPVKANVANVVGVIEGEGPLADETIVIGAHYDHLGYGPFGSRRPNEKAIHNGADDNATGTASIMEIARRFAERREKPARRLVFIGFSAEERGIIGSNYYLSNPLFPLDRTVAMFNFDMVGRLGEQGLSVGGVSSAKEFKALAEKANGDKLLKIKTSGQNGGSDHAGFYRKGIPVLFFFTGLTNEYHTPDDDFETINVDGVVQTIDYAENLLSEVIGLSERPTYVKAAQQTADRGAMPYLGIVPDYSGNSEGLRVTDVSADSPAAEGGLKPNDVIVQLADTPVADIQGLAGALRKQKAGDKVTVIVQRGDEKLSLNVTLGKPQG